MEVYLLSLYLCSMVVDPDISEKLCHWQKVQYYQEIEDCKAAYEKAEEDVKYGTTIEEAKCTLVKVL